MIAHVLVGVLLAADPAPLAADPALIRLVYPAFDPRTNIITAATQYRSPERLQSVERIEANGTSLLYLVASPEDGHTGRTGKLVALKRSANAFEVASTLELGFGLDNAELVESDWPLGDGATGLLFRFGFRGDTIRQVVVMSRGTDLKQVLELKEGTTCRDTNVCNEVSSVITPRRSRANGFAELEVVRSGLDCQASTGFCNAGRSTSLYRFNGDTWVPAEALRSALVKSSTASSTLVEKGSPRLAYSADKAVDGVPETAWVEGVRGAGVGEALTLTLKQPTRLKSISLLAGCGATPALWKKNHRLKQVKVTLDAAEAQLVDLQDVAVPQLLPLRLAEPVSLLRFEIVSVFKGSAFDDACISEVLLEK